MKKNPIETILGIGVLVFAGVFLFYASSRIDVKKVNGYQIYANFLKTGGLAVGSDVRIAGIKVGSVGSATLNQDTYTADVMLNINQDVRLPIDTIATIADSGITGGKYVRLDPGKSQAVLQPGDSLTETKNYKSLEDNVSEFIFLSTK